MPSHWDFNIKRRPGEVYPASNVTGNADTTAYYFENVILTATLAAKMHMHKVFSANRAVLCLDGTHCSALQSPCVSEALSFFSGFRVEQTLLKHTGPHAYTNTINSGACLHLHLFPNQKNTHRESRTCTRTHTNSLSLRNENAKKSVSVIHR